MPDNDVIATCYGHERIFGIAVGQKIKDIVANYPDLLPQTMDTVWDFKNSDVQLLGKYELKLISVNFSDQSKSILFFGKKLSKKRRYYLSDVVSILLNGGVDFTFRYYRGEKDNIQIINEYGDQFCFYLQKGRFYLVEVFSRVI